MTNPYQVTHLKYPRSQVPQWDPWPCLVLGEHWGSCRLCTTLLHSLWITSALLPHHCSPLREEKASPNAVTSSEHVQFPTLFCIYDFARVKQASAAFWCQSQETLQCNRGLHRRLPLHPSTNSYPSPSWITEDVLTVQSGLWCPWNKKGAEESWVSHPWACRKLNAYTTVDLQKKCILTDHVSQASPFHTCAVAALYKGFNHSEQKTSAKAGIFKRH